MALIKGEKIWDMSRISDRDKTRMELTDLIRFKGYWYCGFREGYIHLNHPSGRARIIRSSDGRKWDSVKLIEWDGADVREPKFSISAEEKLMVNTSIAFVSKEPRPDGKPHAFDIYDRPQESGSQYGAFFQLDKPGDPQNDLEENVTRQSVTWLSSDGENWSSAYACPSGINTWRWEVSWHNGMGYSVGYAGKDKKGTLYRTRDGKNWRVLLNEFFPDGFGNEASLAFDSDSTAYCLLRDGCPRKIDTKEVNAKVKERLGQASPSTPETGVRMEGFSPMPIGSGSTTCQNRSLIIGSNSKDLLKESDGHVIESGQGRKVHGGSVPMLGIGKAPYYNEWEWKKLNVNWNGTVASVDEVFRAPFGGPKMIRLSDGRFVAAGRVLGPGRDDGYITLFLVDTKKALLTMFAEIDGNTYSGIAEHEGMLWVSHATADAPGFLGIFLTKVEVPK